MDRFSSDAQTSCSCTGRFLDTIVLKVALYICLCSFLRLLFCICKSSFFLIVFWKFPLMGLLVIHSIAKGRVVTWSFLFVPLTICSLVDNL